MLSTDKYTLFQERFAEVDELGIETTCQACVNILQNCETPFAMGVMGGWGQGKTTVMRHVKARLDSCADVTTVWFDSWKYDLELPLLLPLLATIRETVADIGAKAQGDLTRDDLVARVNKLIVIAATALAPLNAAGSAAAIAATKLSEMYERADSATTFTDPVTSLHNNFREYVERALVAIHGSGKSPRLVIFLDDLDRCSPHLALSVLEHCRVHFDVPGCVFVYGLNADAVGHAVREKYGDGIDPSNYFQKIVNLEVDVSHDSSPAGLMRKFLVDSMGVEMADKCEQYATGLVAAFSDLGLRFNPRVAKRLLYTYALGLSKFPCSTMPGLSARYDLLFATWPRAAARLLDWSTLRDYKQGVGEGNNTGGIVMQNRLSGAWSDIRSAAIPFEFIEQLFHDRTKVRGQ